MLIGPGSAPCWQHRRFSPSTFLTDAIAWYCSTQTCSIAPVRVDLQKAICNNGSTSRSSTIIPHDNNLLGQYCQPALPNQPTGMLGLTVCELRVPTIIETILEGRQPTTLELDDLLRQFPIKWDEQIGSLTKGE
jgi:hypothetical protein